MPNTSRTPGDPFTLPVAYPTRLARAAAVAARPFISAALGLGALRSLYQRTAEGPGATFEARVLQALAVRLDLDASGVAAIPASGPVILAANHPTGALDGLLLAETVRRVRPDVRVLTNHLLARIPELAESCFFVDPFGGPAAAAHSHAGLRAAHLWLRSGGALVMFPSGVVASKPPQTSLLPHTDDPWMPTLGRLALATSSRIVPVFVEGRNSRLFYAAGRVHPTLRTVLLGRELLNKRGTSVRIIPGAAIDSATIRTVKTPAAVTALARQAADAAARGAAPIDPPVATSLLRRDIDRLPEDARLLSSGAFDVYCSDAASLPHVLREIGRLRELTFRAVGEGTGEAADIDRFDSHYRHLFVWHRFRHEVVGAYRIGATDRIVERHGIGGLYTSTLFRYDEALFSRIGPALELGRSFVRAEYQRSYAALLLLWKGLGRVVTRSPQYRVLFGPVSISRRYTDASQQLLRAFLAQNHGSTDPRMHVAPLNPPPALAPPGRHAAAPATVEELDAALKRLEGRCGIPVLLRQYMHLNARLLAFNVDPAFGDALDALMMVDVTQLSASIQHRYLGLSKSAIAA